MKKSTKKKLRSFENRVTLQWIVKNLPIAAIAGVCLSAVVVMVSYFFPIENAWLWAVLVWLGVMLVSVAVLFLLRPRKENMARKLDSFGFKERLQTMWSLKDDDSDFAKMQRMETTRFIMGKEPKEMIKIRSSSKQWAAAGIGVVICVAMCLLPSPQDAVIDEIKSVRKSMQSQAMKIDKAIEDINQSDAVSAKSKELLNEKLQELKKELEKGKDYKEGIKKISEVQKELETVKKEQTQKAMSDMKDALSKSEDEKTQDFAEKLDEKSPESLKAEAEKLMEELDETELKEIAEEMREAAKDIEDEKVAELLEKIADALEESDSEQLQEAVDSMMQGGSSSQELAKISQDLNLSKSQMSKLSKSKAFSGDPSSIKSGKGNNDGDGEGEGGKEGGNGKTPGKGNDNGDGNGNGKGKGNGNGNSNGGSGKGAGSGSGDVVETEKVYDKTRLDEGGEDVDISGEINNDGPKSQTDTDSGEGTLEGMIPYTDVVGEYGDEAVNAAKREQLPPAYQSWVEEYFKSLTE